MPSRYTSTVFSCCSSSLDYLHLVVWINLSLIWKLICFSRWCFCSAQLVGRKYLLLVGATDIFSLSLRLADSSLKHYHFPICHFLLTFVAFRSILDTVFYLPTLKWYQRLSFYLALHQLNLLVSQLSSRQLGARLFVLCRPLVFILSFEPPLCFYRFFFSYFRLGRWFDLICLAQLKGLEAQPLSSVKSTGGLGIGLMYRFWVLYRNFS